MAYGRQVLGTAGTSVEVSADGSPKAKIGGITLDWTAFAPVAGADVTLADGVTVRVGERFARYGQVVARITATGRYGPFDPAAAGTGREALVRGDSFILNRTALENRPADEHPEAIYGGRMWLARIIQAGTGTASLAAGPTRAALEAAFPEMQPVTGN